MIRRYPSFHWENCDWHDSITCSEICHNTRNIITGTYIHICILVKKLNSQALKSATTQNLVARSYWKLVQLYSKKKKDLGLQDIEYQGFTLPSYRKRLKIPTKKIAGCNFLSCHSKQHNCICNTIEYLAVYFPK